eukprot:GHVU01219938.1.p2 GENE.GHVU01219938.1~~GHVU01219938.1.p2  ORF type:complete len:146 (+),score=11.37 GHVU01219938.1:435-872(+)
MSVMRHGDPLGDDNPQVVLTEAQIKPRVLLRRSGRTCTTGRRERKRDKTYTHTFIHIHSRIDRTIKEGVLKKKLSCGQPGSVLASTVRSTANEAPWNEQHRRTHTRITHTHTHAHTHTHTHTRTHTRITHARVSLHSCMCPIEVQ